MNIRFTRVISIRFTLIRLFTRLLEERVVCFDLLEKASTFVDSGVYRTVAMGIDLVKRLKK